MSRDLCDLLPKVHDAALMATQTCIDAGHDLLITCTYRTGAEQDALFEQGRTTPGAIVTNARAGQSMHQYRCALDLVPMRAGKPVWDGKDPLWLQIAAIFKDHGFEWGFDWPRFKEMPHFQRTDGYPLAHFQNGGTLEP